MYICELLDNNYDEFGYHIIDSSKNLIRLLDNFIKTKSYRKYALMIIGETGIGKTYIIKQWAKNRGYNLVFMQTKNDVEKAYDLINNNRTTDTPKFVIFFDMIDRMDRDLQKASYPILGSNNENNIIRICTANIGNEYTASNFYELANDADFTKRVVIHRFAPSIEDSVNTILKNIDAPLLNRSKNIELPLVSNWYRTITNFSTNINQENIDSYDTLKKMIKETIEKAKKNKTSKIKNKNQYEEQKTSKYSLVIPYSLIVKFKSYINSDSELLELIKKDQADKNRVIKISVTLKDLEDNYGLSFKKVEEGHYLITEDFYKFKNSLTDIYQKLKQLNFLWGHDLFELSRSVFSESNNNKDGILIYHSNSTGKVLLLGDKSHILFNQYDINQPLSEFKFYGVGRFAEISGFYELLFHKLGVSNKLNFILKTIEQDNTHIFSFDKFGADLSSVKNVRGNPLLGKKLIKLERSDKTREQTEYNSKQITKIFCYRFYRALSNTLKSFYESYELKDYDNSLEDISKKIVNNVVDNAILKTDTEFYKKMQKIAIETIDVEPDYIHRIFSFFKSSARHIPFSATFKEIVNLILQYFATIDGISVEPMLIDNPEMIEE